MKKSLLLVAFSVVMTLSLASPAFASTGREFGAHHSGHAIEMNGFTADMNPGVHKGFSGWEAH